jgi:hypothetical protein
MSHNYLPCSVIRDSDHHEGDSCNGSCIMGLKSGFWPLVKQYYSIILPQDMSIGLQSSTRLSYFVEALIPWYCQDSISAKLCCCVCLVVPLMSSAWESNLLQHYSWLLFTMLIFWYKKNLHTSVFPLNLRKLKSPLEPRPSTQKSRSTGLV